MIDAHASEGASRYWLIGALLGAWGAAIALAPDLTTRALLATPLVLLPLAWWTLAGPARWTMLFLCAALLAPPLPVPWGDTGPHPSLLVAGLGVLAGLLRKDEWTASRGARRGHSQEKLDEVVLAGGRQETLSGEQPSRLNFCLVLYLVALLASLPFAAIYSGAALAAASLARVLLFGVGVYLYFYTAQGPGSGVGVGEGFANLRLLFWCGLASALFACVDFYWQLPAPAGFGPQYVWMESEIYRRAQGVFYEASTLGNLCVFFLVMIGVSLLRPRAQSPVSRPVLWIGAVVFFSALMLSFSRASLLSLGAAAAVLFWLHLWLHGGRFRWRWLIGIPAAATLAVATTSWLFPRFADFYWLRLWASWHYFLSATEGVLSGRLASWRYLAAFLVERPWHALLGVGYKTLPYSDFVGRPVVADNAYLSALVETGLFGLAAMLAWNLALLGAGWRAARNADPRVSFFGAWILCFWSGQLAQMMSGDLLTYWRVLPLYFWVLAMAVRR